jgi:hypothetical protein
MPWSVACNPSSGLVNNVTGGFASAESPHNAQEFLLPEAASRNQLSLREDGDGEHVARPRVASRDTSSIDVCLHGVACRCQPN